MAARGRSNMKRSRRSAFVAGATLRGLDRRGRQAEDHAGLMAASASHTGRDSRSQRAGRLVVSREPNKPNFTTSVTAGLVWLLQHISQGGRDRNTARPGGRGRRDRSMHTVAWTLSDGSLAVREVRVHGADGTPTSTCLGPNDEAFPVMAGRFCLLHALGRGRFSQLFRCVCVQCPAPLLWCTVRRCCPAQAHSVACTAAVREICSVTGT